MPAMCIEFSKLEPISLRQCDLQLATGRLECEVAGMTFNTSNSGLSVSSQLEKFVFPALCWGGIASSSGEAQVHRGSAMMRNDVLVCSGKESTNPTGKVVDFLANLCPCPHLWPRATGSGVSGLHWSSVIWKQLKVELLLVQTKRRRVGWSWVADGL